MHLQVLKESLTIHQAFVRDAKKEMTKKVRAAAI
jgi:hypothetical protein